MSTPGGHRTRPPVLVPLRIRASRFLSADGRRLARCWLVLLAPLGLDAAAQVFSDRTAAAGIAVTFTPGVCDSHNSYSGGGGAGDIDLVVFANRDRGRFFGDEPAAGPSTH